MFIKLLNEGRPILNFGKGLYYRSGIINSSFQNQFLEFALLVSLSNSSISGSTSTISFKSLSYARSGTGGIADFANPSHPKLSLYGFLVALKGS
jgi:hypothetical protein